MALNRSKLNTGCTRPAHRRPSGPAAGKSCTSAEADMVVISSVGISMSCGPEHSSPILKRNGCNLGLGCQDGHAIRSRAFTMTLIVDASHGCFRNVANRIRPSGHGPWPLSTLIWPEKPASAMAEPRRTPCLRPRRNSDRDRRGSRRARGKGKRRGRHGREARIDRRMCSILRSASARPKTRRRSCRRVLRRVDCGDHAETMCQQDDGLSAASIASPIRFVQSAKLVFPNPFARHAARSKASLPTGCAMVPPELPRPGMTRKSASCVRMAVAKKGIRKVGIRRRRSRAAPIAGTASEPEPGELRDQLFVETLLKRNETRRILFVLRVGGRETEFDLLEMADFFGEQAF